MHYNIYKRYSNIFEYLIMGSVLCIGLWLVPMRIMHFDLSFIPGDFIDNRFNNYILEHGYKWLTGKVMSFWDAPIFYPVKNATAFSDNHLGTLLFYSFFRLIQFDRETSFQLWIITLFVLNYITAAWALGRMSVNIIGVVCGAFIFSFSMPMVAQLSHVQLLPRFMIPLVFYYAFRYFEDPGAKVLLKLCICLVIQFYCTIYMGYFVVLALLALVCGYILIQYKDRPKIKSLFAASIKDFAIKTGVIVFSILLLLPLIIQYSQVSKEFGSSSWQLTSSMLPRIFSYFFPPGSSLLWDWLVPLGGNLPMREEHRIFVGALPLVALFAAPIIYCCLNKKDDLMKKSIVVVISLFLLFISTLSINGYSLYRIISKIIPGLDAIRAVARIILVDLFLFSLLLGIVITKIFEHATYKSYFFKIALSIILVGAVIIDQFIIHSPMILKMEARARSKQVENLIVREKPDGKIFVYMPEKKNASLNITFMTQLDAMLAAQNLDKATVNGYSGVYPSEWLNFGKSFGKSFDQMCLMLRRWMIISEKRYDKKYWHKDLAIVGAGNIDPCSDYKDLKITYARRPLDKTEYRAELTFDKNIHNVKLSEVFLLDVTLRNKSKVLWHAEGETKGRYAIYISYRWLLANKKPLTTFDPRFGILFDLEPGRSRLFTVEALAPSKKGTFFLEFDLVQESVAWFRDRGSKPPSIEIIVE